jgi:hypothetical protein
MAIIDINLSSKLVNGLGSNNELSTTMAEELGLFFQAAYTFSSTHPYYSTYSLVGNNLRLNYSDDGYSSYSGVALADPNALSGSASATNLEQYFPSYYRLTASGNLNYHYEATANGPNIQGTGGTLTAAAIQTLLPSYSPNYDSNLGNVILGIRGNVTLSPTSDISGVVTTLTGSADRLLTSSTLTGNFNISGNATNIAQNLGTLSVSGTATSYIEKYADGSGVSLSNIAFAVTGDTTIDNKLLANPNNLPADDVINVTLGAAPFSAWVIASGAGNDKISIKGGASSLSVNAGTGNDMITLGDSNHVVDGGAGTDTVVFNGVRSAYSVSKTVNGYAVLSSGGTDTLNGVERLHFSDTTLALDINGNGGQVYRLYQAAFNRTPDNGGLGFWINAMDSGATLKDIALEFTKSGEFRSMYGGANPDNTTFLDKLYHNVLHRAGDQSGFDFWLGHLNSGTLTQAAALAEFGESAENQATLISVIGNGFTYTPYG